MYQTSRENENLKRYLFEIHLPTCSKSRESHLSLPSSATDIRYLLLFLSKKKGVKVTILVMLKLLRSIVTPTYRKKKIATVQKLFHYHNILIKIKYSVELKKNFLMSIKCTHLIFHFQALTFNSSVTTNSINWKLIWQFTISYHKLNLEKNISNILVFRYL